MKTVRTANIVILILSVFYMCNCNNASDYYVIKKMNLGMIIMFTAIGTLFLTHSLFEEKKKAKDGNRKSADEVASIFIGQTLFVFVFLLVGLLILSPQFTTNKDIDYIKVFIGIYLISNVPLCKYLFK